MRRSLGPPPRPMLRGVHGGVAVEKFRNRAGTKPARDVSLPLPFVSGRSLFSLRSLVSSCLRVPSGPDPKLRRGQPPCDEAEEAAQKAELNAGLRTPPRACRSFPRRELPQRGDMDYSLASNFGSGLAVQPSTQTDRDSARIDPTGLLQPVLQGNRIPVTQFRGSMSTSA